MPRHLLPRGLLARSFLIVVTPLVLAQIIIASVFWANHWERVTGRMTISFVSEVELLIDLLVREPPEGREAVLAIARRYGVDATLETDTALPQQHLERDHSSTERHLIRVLREHLRIPFMAALSGPADREVQMWLLTEAGLLHVEAPRKLLDSSTTTVFTLWMVLSSALLLGVAMLFMRNQVRSVRRLAAAAESFGKGRDVPDFKPEGAREVRQAATAFLQMRDRIRRYVGQRTQMLAGISHDLRTPLTRMKLQLAMMGDSDGVAELREDVSEMERMVDGYLAFARGEGSESVEDGADLCAILEDVVARCRRSGEVGVELTCEEDLLVPLRPHAFARCMTNLIGNAIRHGSHVVVEAARRGDGVEITVDDDGPGIPADHRDAAFKAFVRLDDSRNPQTGGVGLGLTIARDLVRAHGGEIWLQDSPLGGLRVKVRMPL
jgi:two-component system osmolarity sensor histidine kinase EnvZ